MATGETFFHSFGIGVPPITIVDVGAMAEGVDRYANLLSAGLATVVGFEPNPVELARLHAHPRPRRSYLPYCLGRGGPATLHVTEYPGCTSLYRPNVSLIEMLTSFGAANPGGNFFVTHTEPVVTRRLDDIAECPPPDYLKLDVQGAELDVLAGAERALQQCLIVEAEVEFVPLYEGQPLFAEIDQFLRARGFVLHKLIDVAGRAIRPMVLMGDPDAPMSQLLWADAVFIRDFTRLDLLGDEQLLKLATILHEPYRSGDMAYHLLTEYDRRRGARAHETLLDWMRTQGPETLFMNLRSG